MSLLKTKQLITTILLSFGVITTPVHAGVIDGIFRLFSKAAAPAEGVLVKEEGKILANGGKVIDESSGVLDDFAKWFKRMIGVPVDTKLENELARRFGDYAKKKVRNETKECAMKIYKANDSRQSQHKRSEERSRDLCAGAVLKCLDTRYRKVKNPTEQMLNLCIKEINTNIHQYVRLK